MKAPKTNKEAEQYIGQYFIIPKIPDNREEGFTFTGAMDCLIGEELECIEIVNHSHFGSGIYARNENKEIPRFGWYLNWEWIELVGDMEGVEDLLDHWE